MPAALDPMKIYQIRDKATGENLMRVTSDCVKRARQAFYSTKGFTHYSNVVCQEIKGALPRSNNSASHAFTHRGKRSPQRMPCEKCNTATNWFVAVCGRQAFWCGCGN